MLRRLKTISIRICGNFLYLLSSEKDKDIIVVDTCFDNVNNCSVGVVYDYFTSQNEKVVVVKNDKNHLKDGDILKSSFLYYKTILRAKLIVCNNAHHIYAPKKKGTYLLLTWHGTPYKSVAIGKFATKVLAYTNRNVDEHLSGSEYFDTNYLANTINYTGFVSHDGFFRNDCLVNCTKKIKGLPFTENNKKNILICPTWRDYGNEELIQKTQELITRINLNMNDTYNVLVRMHNKIVESSEFNLTGDFYLVGTSDFVTTDVLSITDLLITDYSSIFFDFALLKRPIMLFQFDKEKYCKERGLIIDDIKNEYGLSVCDSVDSLDEYIKTFDEQTEIDKVKAFNEKINQTETGKSFEKFLARFN